MIGHGQHALLRALTAGRRLDWSPRFRALAALLLFALGVIHASAEASPIVLQEFEGLSDADNLNLIQSRVNPPDNALAVGPAHIVEMVNFVGRITDKAGTVLSRFSLETFFGADAGFRVGDARILYDARSGRWYATSMNFSNTAASSSVILAVSTTDDPTGPFCRYRLGNPATERFHQDYPFVGITDDKIVVSYDAFDFTTSVNLGSGFYVLNKAQAMACTPSIQFVRSAPAPSSLKPAQALSGTTTAYLVGHTVTSVTIRSITGVPGGAPVQFADTTIPMANAWRAPPLARQRGSSELLDIDPRTQTVTWQNNSLWLGGNGDCLLAGDTTTRSCVRLVEVRTDSMTIRQEIIGGAVGRYAFHPAARPDASGNLIVVFMESSDADFPNIRVAGRLATDPLNTLQPSILVRAGEAPATSSLAAHSDLETRIGDYSGAAVDPIDPLTVWVSSEYIQAGGDWGTYVAAVTLGTQVASTASAVPVRGDFGGDHRDDLAFWLSSNGVWSIVDTATGTRSLVVWGGPGDTPAPGDFNGDGKADIAVWRASTGAWFVMTDRATRASFAVGWGAPGDIPVPGDYDGDRRTDLAVWRPGNGGWYIVNSSTGAFRGVGWGAPGDIPVPGDYDGDGKTDIAVWRPASGAWFIVSSRTGAGLGVGWGGPGDIPVPADYDGDGRTDVAVWRPADGTWYIVRSSDGGVVGIQFGARGLGDIPVPIDFAGAGRAQIAIFRTSTGEFFVAPPLP